MNKKVKKVAIWLVALLGLILLFVGYFLFKFQQETSKMTPVATGRISDDVIAIKDEFANMYLVKDSSRYIAIDAGKDLKVIKSELDKLNINPDQIEAVLLTHTDMDHVAAISLFNKAELYFARNELKMLNGEKQKIPFYNNSISRNEYTLLGDQQELKIGAVRIACILTEGHTSGSMCYQVNDKYLFTGDILSLHDGKLGESVKFFDLDHQKTIKSISKITHLSNVEFILTSHFGITDNYINAVSSWKQ